MDGIKLGTDILLFNPYFREARLAIGCNSVAELHRVTGITQTTLGRYERLKDYPRTQSQTERVEKALQRTFDMLFPREIREAIDAGLGKWKKIQRIHEVPIASIGYNKQELITYQSNDIHQHDLERITKETLEHLSERERQILELRFGLNETEPKTLEEVGNIFNVHRQRVRQVEAKALRKLRHPTRVSGFRQCLDGGGRTPDFRRNDIEYRRNLLMKSDADKLEHKWAVYEYEPWDIYYAREGANLYDSFEKAVAAGKRQNIYSYSTKQAQLFHIVEYEKFEGECIRGKNVASYRKEWREFDKAVWVKTAKRENNE